MSAPSLIYIFSAGHSGSTLLSSIIGRHEKAFNAGEIGYLSRLVRLRDESRILCSCGASAVLECPFWRRIDAELQQANGRGLNDLKIGLSKGDTADDRLLFDTVAAVAGVSAVIDTSKNYRRLKRLMNDSKMSTLPVILIADPRKIVHSMRGRIGTAKYALRLNRLGLRMLNAVRLARAKGLNPIVVQYEEFAEKPVDAVTRILGRVGLRFENELLNWETGERHDLGGNHIKFGKSNTVRKDERWRADMRSSDQLAVLVLSPIFQLATKWLLWRERTVGRKEIATLDRLKDAD